MKNIEQIIQQFSDKEQEGWSFEEKIDFLRSKFTEYQEKMKEEIEQEKLSAGIKQALAERERIVGIIDEYNLGGQYDGIIEQIKKI
jgi:hypothetical protein